MGCQRQRTHLLNPRQGGEGLVLRAPSGAVSARDEVGVKPEQILEIRRKILHAHIRFRRKEFEGKYERVGLVDFFQCHRITLLRQRSWGFILNAMRPRRLIKHSIRSRPTHQDRIRTFNTHFR